ncbi:hypothetical protein QJS04_geneDACA010635 [Acorus gramineus]|uniref:Uncharacterized protein n=1 Tax=Acorus gramineus TaxID=55184 RepID=A0AAV9AKZ2_ACOGR|nr:hypothetical protein QJS04_geneDACA010635 [Acorus gramineus]
MAQHIELSTTAILTAATVLAMASTGLGLGFIMTREQRIYGDKLLLAGLVLVTLPWIAAFFVAVVVHVYDVCAVRVRNHPDGRIVKRR